MNITAYFESVGVPATGLIPTIKIRNIVTGGLAVDSLPMTEVGDGFYRYEFSAYDYTVAY